MTRSEFEKLIENGSDIMFSVFGRKYTILTWTDLGICIGEQYPNDGELQYYDTPAELLRNFKINNIPIGEITKDIFITQYS